MKSILSFSSLIFSSILILISYSAASGQDGETKVPDPILVDEFGTLGHCEFTARIDSFFTELSQKPDHQGYILTYKSVDELPGDRDTYPVERFIVSHISFRNFERSRITFLRAGYLTEKRTQLWVLPPGAAVPRGLDVLPAPPIPVSKTFLFANKALASDAMEISPEMGLGGEGEPLPEFILESVKEQEEAEQAEWEKGIAAEEVADDAGADEKSSNGVETAQTGDSSDDEVATEEEPADTRTEEQREEARFAWAKVGIAELISSRMGSRGVIIFYADDQRYDIAKLTAFVERGRDLIATTEGIAPSRLKIMFGGYRRSPGVEFWFVPAKGKTPNPTPEERPVDEPEEAEEN